MAAPRCCFDTSEYTGLPDTTPVLNPMDVPAALSEYDILNFSGRIDEAEVCLDALLNEAMCRGDWRAQLSFLSEMAGLCRNTGKRDKALSAIDEALELLKSHGLGRTVSGATVILNCATTMKHFGMAEDSIPLFKHVSRVFSDMLDPSDYRFAGLFNNMGLSYCDMGDYASAERCFRLAIGVLEKCGNADNDIAVSYCNLANLYDSVSHEDERINECAEKAWEHLNVPSLPFDSYHAYTISKCLSCFDRFGFFLYAAELRRRMEAINSELGDERT